MNPEIEALMAEVKRLNAVALEISTAYWKLEAEHSLAERDAEKAQSALAQAIWDATRAEISPDPTTPLVAEEEYGGGAPDTDSTRLSGPSASTP